MKSILVNAYVAWVRTYRRLVYALRYGRQKIHIDPTSYVSGKSRIRVQGGGSIVIGKGCEIHDFAMILTYGGDISFGDHCSLNPFSIVYGHGGVRIGDGVRIDGVLTSGFVIQEAIKKGIPIKAVGAPVYYEPLAAASDKARPGSAAFVKKVGEIFEAMHKDGTLTKLSMKWYGFDVTKKVK